MSNKRSGVQRGSQVTGSEASLVDAIVVGSGFAGLYALYRLRRLGFSVRVFEAASGVGGTWFWNGYPGARCDIESMEYSYQFSDELQQEWVWTERFAAQPEILRYLNHVADRFDLRRDIDFNTRVEVMRYDEDANLWEIKTEHSTTWARFCIMATGCLSAPNMPEIEGIETFCGACCHTGKWPQAGVDFSDKQVGVVGTGSSAIQSIPLIAEEAKRLFVFQRTASYSVPAHNQPLSSGDQDRVKARYSEFRQLNGMMPFGFGSDYPRNQDSALEASPEERQKRYEERWNKGGLFFLGAFGDLLSDTEANETAAGFVREKIHEIVHDPEVAKALSPQQAIGCKRLCIDTGFYKTFNRPNVTLVDVKRNPIERITPNGIRVSGREYGLDCIVFATGFDAMTGALDRIEIRGRSGRTLRQKWQGGPRAYLGLGMAGFPNLFTVTGPESPSVLSNMIPSIEQHVDWIAECLRYMREHDFGLIEPTLEAEDDWVSHVNAVADSTLFPQCNSWYLGANVSDKPRVFAPYIGFPQYVKKCDDVVARGYEGFFLSRLTPNAEGVEG